MNTIRILCSLFAIAAAATAFGGEPADPAGTWKWNTTSPDDDIPTTLQLEWKDGQLAGAYANRYGATAVSNASLKHGVITFDVVRDFGGQKYVIKYHGKLDGGTIKGTIEAPGHDGGAGVKLDWNATRAARE